MWGWRYTWSRRRGGSDNPGAGKLENTVRRYFSNTSVVLCIASSLRYSNNVLKKNHSQIESSGDGAGPARAPRGGRYTATMQRRTGSATPETSRFKAHRSFIMQDGPSATDEQSRSSPTLVDAFQSRNRFYHFTSISSRTAP